MTIEFPRMQSALKTYDDPLQRACEVAWIECVGENAEFAAERVFLQFLILSGEFQNWLAE